MSGSNKNTKATLVSFQVGISKSRSQEAGVNTEAGSPGLGHTCLNYCQTPEQTCNLTVVVDFWLRNSHVSSEVERSQGSHVLGTNTFLSVAQGRLCSGTSVFKIYPIAKVIFFPNTLKTRYKKMQVQWWNAHFSGKS